jgi:MoaA/NifB/PqqE/SkfB family radical SAM enzyme
MNEKKVFTSNSAKLLGNIDRLAEFKVSGILRPITLDAAPTNSCNQNCGFCFVKDRDKSFQLTYEQVIECTDYYIKQGIRGIELTGGGEPTMWPYLAKYIDYCAEKKLKIGLITNGLKLHEFEQETLAKLTFVRVSLNGIDNGWFPTFKVPSNVVLSFNYVWHEGSQLFKHGPILMKIITQYPDARALKIQKDVFSKINVLSIPDFGDPRVFIMEKTNDVVPTKCYMGWLKPHLDADGFIYRCSCSATFNRRFKKEYRIGTLNSVGQYPDADKFSTAQCSYCYFAVQNNFVQQVDEEVEHKEFI